MNHIIVEEAVNGFMVTIMWNGEPTYIEVCETRADAYKIISRWLAKKMDEEIWLLTKAAGEVL